MSKYREDTDMKYSNEEMAEIITGELEAQQKKFAKHLLNGFGTYMDNNLNTRAVLTKAEKKMLRQEKRRKFFNKLRILFLGDDTTIERPY